MPVNIDKDGNVIMSASNNITADGAVSTPKMSPTQAAGYTGIKPDVHATDIELKDAIDQEVLTGGDTPPPPPPQGEYGVDKADYFSKTEEVMNQTNAQLLEDQLSADSAALGVLEKTQEQNQDAGEQIYGAEYSNRQMTDKFGWTGGQLMDSETRMQALRDQLSAGILSNEQYIDTKYANDITKAKAAMVTNNMAIAQEAANDAYSSAIAVAEITGVYIDPIAGDLVGRYVTSVANNPDGTVDPALESQLIAAGFYSTNEDGTKVLHTEAIEAISGVINSLDRDSWTMGMKTALLEQGYSVDEVNNLMSTQELIDSGEEVETDDGDEVVAEDTTETPIVVEEVLTDEVLDQIDANPDNVFDSIPNPLTITVDQLSKYYDGNTSEMTKAFATDMVGVQNLLNGTYTADDVDGAVTTMYDIFKVDARELDKSTLKDLGYKDSSEMENAYILDKMFNYLMVGTTDWTPTDFDWDWDIETGNDVIPGIKYDSLSTAQVTWLESMGFSKFERGRTLGIAGTGEEYMCVKIGNSPSGIAGLTNYTTAFKDYYKANVPSATTSTTGSTGKPLLEY